MSMPIKSILTLSLVFLLVALFTCNNRSAESTTLNMPIEYSSISIVNGIYKIDTNIAISNGTKEKLITKLEIENLIDKKTVAEIPDFIKSFLDGVSINQSFDIANPDEEWQEGGWVNGFDNEKKAIIQATSSLAKPFPNKQLIYCGIGKNMALISYYMGGIKKTQNNIIIKFQNQKIVDLWFDYYKSPFGNLLGGNTNFVKTKADIIKYIKNTNSGGC